MAELLAIIIEFMVADLLSWTDFSIVSDSKVVVDSLSRLTSIRDIYASFSTYCRELPRWNLKKEVRHVLRQEVHYADCFSHQAVTEIPQQLRLFGLSTSLSCVGEAIICDFGQTMPCYDVSLDSCLLPPLVVKEQENCVFPFDVP